MTGSCPDRTLGAIFLRHAAVFLRAAIASVGSR